MNSPASKLVLGTVQFGCSYGINSAGRPSGAEVQRILDLALCSGITTLDTSSAYGDAESVIGSCGAARFRLVSKYPEGGGDIADIPADGEDQRGENGGEYDKELFHTSFTRPFRLESVDGFLSFFSDLLKPGYQFALAVQRLLQHRRRSAEIVETVEVDVLGSEKDVYHPLRSGVTGGFFFQKQIIHIGAEILI